MISWLKKIYFHESAIRAESFMEQFDKKLTNYLYNTYTKIRIDQLFNIIIGKDKNIWKYREVDTL